MLWLESFKVLSQYQYNPQLPHDFQINVKMLAKKQVQYTPVPDKFFTEAALLSASDQMGEGGKTMATGSNILSEIDLAESDDEKLAEAKIVYQKEKQEEKAAKCQKEEKQQNDACMQNLEVS